MVEVISIDSVQRTEKSRMSAFKRLLLPSLVKRNGCNMAGVWTETIALRFLLLKLAVTRLFLPIRCGGKIPSLLVTPMSQQVLTIMRARLPHLIHRLRVHGVMD